MEVRRKHNTSPQKSDSSVGDGVLKRSVEEESLADDDVVADFIINLLFAGNETTSKTMLFAVYFLTQNPKAIKQLLEEQCSLKNNNSNGKEMLTWEDYKAMPFTQCVIDETLRLGGIAIWLMMEATNEVQYEDFIIPKGSFVVPFLSAVHLNETIFSDPLSLLLLTLGGGCCQRIRYLRILYITSRCP